MTATKEGVTRTSDPEPVTKNVFIVAFVYYARPRSKQQVFSSVCRTMTRSSNERAN